ncbi:NBAS subunit of NRZ tethering complex-like [Littorina saxatilis]|uniref:Neuroblastoma-amplified sequence n=1 Tax=Littorina saxatilis TaxID=31220 RepID=A0AAN9C2Z5_9CAEN
MAAEGDDVDSKDEENILYDLAVLAEWKFDNEIFTRSQRRKSSASTIARLTSIAQRISWAFLRTLRLQPLEAAGCSLPEPLMGMVSSTLPWHLAISSSGTLAAVLQESCVEIRSQRDGFEGLVGRGSLPVDSNPHWRCMVWSPDESMVACARSSGVVDVFDMVGTLLFSIQKPGAEAAGMVQDLSNSVSALIFTDIKPSEKKWSAELLVIQHSGVLHSYFVDRDNGFLLRHQFLFTDEYPLGIAAATYDPKHKVLFVGGAALSESDGDAIPSRCDGVTAWRVLSDAPHYKILTDVDDKAMAAKRRSWLAKLRSSAMLSWAPPDMDGVFRLSLSPDGTSLVGLHHSGRLSVWDVPSLRLRHSTPLEEQPGFDEVNAALAENPTKRKKMKDLIPHKKLIDVNFWSSQAIILARCSGAVTVSSINTLKNLLGTSPEWFEPSPRVAEANDGGFLGLECELRFPKQRILLGGGDDDDVEDSDDEDKSMVAMTTRATKQVMYYLTDSERFQPPKKKPKTVTKVYRMVWLKSTTPEELFSRKIDAEEYGEALALAQAYGLDCDLVYQRQWRRSPVSLASISDYLSKISKRAWVLHECMERVPENIDAARELLQYGLRGTDLPALSAITNSEDAGKFMLCDPEDGLYEDADVDRFNPAEVHLFEEKKKEVRQQQLAEVEFKNLTLEQKELCRARLKLLQFLDRLKTYECILGGGSAAAERFNADFYKEFRAQNIVQLAAEYAQSSDWRALETLFTFHHADLASHRLAILSNFPETTLPADYGSLLPELGTDGEVNEMDKDMWREEDWSEMDMCRSEVKLDQEDLGAFLYDDCPDLLKYRVESPSAELVQEWYEMRVGEIEASSRMVDNALELSKLAIQRGFDGLRELLDDLVTMETLVYECGVGDSLTLASLREMSEYTRIELMMDKCPLDMYAKNARRWLVPVLQRCEVRDPGSYRRLLHEFLLTRARTDLTIPLKIFQTSKVGVAHPIITSAKDMMEFAVDVIYCTERDDQLDVAMDIFSCLPQKAQQNESADILRLHKQVDSLEHHLRAAKILQDNGVKKTPAFIKSSQDNCEEAQNLIIRLTRSAGRKTPALKEVEWYKLHDDIMTLRDIVYRCLSPSLCHQIFVESLLCSSSQDNIRLAGEMMERQKQQPITAGSGRSQGSRRGQKAGSGRSHMQKLEYDTAVTLALSAACEYFDSSANLTHVCMDLARSCLNLILDSPPPVQEELDIIASLAILDDFSVSILPLQVRLSKNRLDLVRQAVASKPTNYKQSQKLLRLGHLLRVEAKDSAERDGKVLLLLAQAALGAGDNSFAHQCCQQLVAASYGPAWTVCVDLAHQESFKVIAAKVSLLSFAVTFCSPDMIEPILQARSLLQRQLLLEKVGKVLSQQVHADTATAGGDGSEDTTTGADRSSRQGSPFSARAALEQTQAILSSTQRHTRAVLSSVTDTAWWKGAVKSLKRPLRQRGEDEKGGAGEGNPGFTKQGCHPFYEDVIGDCYLDLSSADYGYLGEEKPAKADLSQSVLRTARLEETLTEGENCEPAEEALLELGQHWLPSDTSLGLAYLLSLPKAEAADKCLSSISQSGLALEVSQYYYALQIYSALRPSPLPHPASVYLHLPSRLSKIVVQHINSQPERDWPEGVKGVIPHLLKCRSRLEDWNQAQALQRLAPGVDGNRFASDPEYKKETILGLAMSCEEEVYGMAVHLAERYNLPLWDIFMAHLEYLFSDSGLSTQEVKERVSRLNMLETLREKPQEFCSCLYTHVYPSVSGSDHARLLYFFSLLEGQDEENLLCEMPAAEHGKLLKKLKSVAPDIDYVKLMDKKTSPKDILAPYLTSANINNIMKLAAKIPDKKGGFLHPSSLYCGWAIRVFWEGDKAGKAPPQSAAAWIHRYELCGEYIQRLLPDDFVTFVNTITCSRDSSLQLEVSCRQEIVRRAIKFCHTQAGKKKGEGSEKEWLKAEKQLGPLQAHLESLDSDTIRSFLQAGEPKFKQYGLHYDLSCGDPEKVGQLLVLMVVEGQPLELVEDLLTVAPPVGVSVADVLHKALRRIVAALRGEEEEEDHKIYDPLQRLEQILENVQEHIENEGELAGRKDVFEVLHPYVSDSTVSMQQRSAVLEILEKTVGLGGEHASILLFCKTSHMVKPVWGEVALKEEELNKEEGRRALFSQLLAATKLASGYNALCQLLRLWPEFTSQGEGENPWTQTFNAMAGSTNTATVALIDTVLRDLGAADFPLNLVDTKLVFDALLRHQHPLEGVKVILRSSHKKLYPSAVLVLSAEEEVDDPDLVDLALRRELAPQLVSTPVYALIMKAVVKAQTQGAAAPPHLQLDTVVGQLQEAGLQAEARTLIQQAQASKPLLQSFGSALGAMGGWFKS